MPEFDNLISLVLNHPITYIVIIIVGIYFIMRQVNQGKLKPEQKPDFGVRFREARVKKALKKREDAFAIRPKKAYLYRDVFRIGRIKTVELIPTKWGVPNKDGRVKKVTEEMLYSICYRGFGMVAWLKDWFGFGRKRIVVDDTNIMKNFNDINKEIHYVINNNIFFRERGGILIISRDAEKMFIDEINADLDYENAKGFVSDFPRRLSNLHPAHASATDSMELEEQLEAKSEGRKRFFWSKGGN